MSTKREISRPLSPKFLPVWPKRHRRSSTDESRVKRISFFHIIKSIFEKTGANTHHSIFPLSLTPTSDRPRVSAPAMIRFRKKFGTKIGPGSVVDNSKASAKAVASLGYLASVVHLFLLSYQEQNLTALVIDRLARPLKKILNAYGSKHHLT